MAMPPVGRRLNLSNAITLLRLASVPFFCRAISVGQWRVAAALFWLAVASDWSDGRLARARGEASRLGGLLDHASDACLVSAGLAVLALDGRITRWLPVLVVVAFVQYVLDSRWLAGRPLRTSALGRWNGILYFVPLGIVVTREALGLAWPVDPVVALLAWALAGSTAVSMLDRALALLRRPPDPDGGGVRAPDAGGREVEKV
ncbi:MAG: CDP-alcohol phosphatidyltransferase family protein [Myxococcota bacterium]